MIRSTVIGCCAGAVLAVPALSGCAHSPTPQADLPPASPSATPLTVAQQAVVDGKAALARYRAVENRIAHNPNLPLAEFETVAARGWLTGVTTAYRAQARPRGIHVIGTSTYAVMGVRNLILTNGGGHAPSMDLVTLHQRKITLDGHGRTIRLRRGGDFGSKNGTFTTTYT